MPFGLRNTPSTFQALMNRLFGKLLRKFVLFFFLMIFSYTVQTVNYISSTSKKFLKFLRQISCPYTLRNASSDKKKITYLGHWISKQGVMVDAEKIEATQ